MVDEPLSLYDEVEMKRPHPCSTHSKKFQVVRVGADVKIQCLGCGNVIMMDRDSFNKKLKKILCHHSEILMKS